MFVQPGQSFSVGDVDGIFRVEAFLACHAADGGEEFINPLARDG